MKHPLDWTPRFEDWEDPWFPADRKLLDPLFSRSAARQRGYCNITYCTQLTYGVSPNFPMVSQKITLVFYQDFLDTKVGSFPHENPTSTRGPTTGVSDSPSQVGSVGISKSNGLVMKVSAVDYLAATTVICTDKTGTLTEAMWAMVGHGGWWAMVGGGPWVDGFMVKMLGEWFFCELNYSFAIQ